MTSPAGLRAHTASFIPCPIAIVRRTISLKPNLAAQLDRGARRRGISFSAVIAELVQRAPAELPYEGLIEDDPDLSLRIEEVLGRLNG